MPDGSRVRRAVELDDGARVVWSSSGLWLVEPGAAVDLLDAVELRFEERAFADRLHVGERVLSIPRGRGGDTRELIALARLAALREHAVDPPMDAPLLEARGTLETAWLVRWLEPDELLLAWLERGGSAEVASSVGATRRVDGFFALTSERAALVAIGPLGDVELVELEASTPSVTREAGRSRVTASGHEWTTTLGNAAAYEAAAELAPHGRAGRILGAARVAWTGKKRDEAAARRLLDRLDTEGSAWARITRWAIGLEVEVPDEAVVEMVAHGDGERLARWWERWGVGDERGRALLRAVRAHPDGVYVGLPLHGRLRDALLEGRDAPVDDGDVEYADHLVAAGREEDARVLLESLLPHLPDADLLDLIPHPPGATPTVEALRESILRRLAPLRGGGAPHAPTLVELARLGPLDAARVAALADAAPEPLGQRARDVLALLSPRALEPREPGPVREVAPLAREALEQHLRHPASRPEGVLDRLQSVVAAVEVPDHAALQSFCERLGPAEGATHEALADACLALGTPGVQAYVSRGERSVGVRAYEGTPSFVLIGGDHLAPGSSYRLGPSELRFALGAEIAHLRFGHSRVTSSEVWAGALDYGKSAFGLLLGVVPVLGAWKYGGALGALADRLDDGSVNRVLGSAGRLLGLERGSTEPAIDRGTEELIAAHRMMQLTADRAGLVLCGDLHAAVRALFLTRPRYHAELPIALRAGLPAALSRRGDDGELLAPDLSVRACALLSFYLSDDYVALTGRGSL